MNWTTTQKNAYKSIKKYGTEVTITTCATMGTYSSSTDIYSQTQVVSSTYAVCKNYKNSDIDGTLIQTGDRELLIPAYGIPALDEQVKTWITLGAKTLNPITVRTVAPGGTALIYKIQIRE